MTDFLQQEVHIAFLSRIRLRLVSKPCDHRPSREATCPASTIVPFSEHWRALVAADLVYKAIAFAVLTPLIGLMLRLLIRRTGRTAVADADIALFFFTTRPGVLALLLIGALGDWRHRLGTDVLDDDHARRDAGAQHARARCARSRGGARVPGRAPDGDDLRARARDPRAVRRDHRRGVLGLLTGHDINFYLTYRPPAFTAALAIAGVTVAALAVVLARRR